MWSRGVFEITTLLDQSGVCPSRRGPDACARMPREAAHVEFVDDGLGEGPLARLIAFPVVPAANRRRRSSRDGGVPARPDRRRAVADFIRPLRANRAIGVGGKSCVQYRSRTNRRAAAASSSAFTYRVARCSPCTMHTRVAKAKTPQRCRECSKLRHRRTRNFPRPA